MTAAVPLSPVAEFRYEALPPFDLFERVSDPEIYAPLPDGWMLGVADVVNSTDALGDGRYKAVNMAGASVVAAVMNALAGARFPFVFGGDGAVLAVPPEGAERTRAAMAATANYVSRELGLQLRVGMVSVAAIRAAGHDLRVSRYAASSNAVYAMFAGGGASYAEAELKAGRIALAPAPPDAQPDLTGLSCRWSPLQSRRGVILSLVVIPAAGVAPERFRGVANEVVAITQHEDQAGHPVPPEGPEFSVDLPSLKLEAAAPRTARGAPTVRLATLAIQQMIGWVASRSGLKVGKFDARRYKQVLSRNSDFRKYDDGLRMTLDCTPATADALEALLTAAERDGSIEFGLHRQDAALITCLVPSILEDDHLHFLDGAGGGYAVAARTLKAKREARKAASSQSLVA